MNDILADESVDFNIINKLREDGYVVKAIVEDSPGITDEEVLTKALRSLSILLTEDTDFGELTYRLQLPSAGIVLLRMSGEKLELKINQLYILFEKYRDKLSSSFCVVTASKIRVISLAQWLITYAILQVANKSLKNSKHDAAQHYASGHVGFAATSPA